MAVSLAYHGSIHMDTLRDNSWSLPRQPDRFGRFVSFKMHNCPDDIKGHIFNQFAMQPIPTFHSHQSPTILFQIEDFIWITPSFCLFESVLFSMHYRRARPLPSMLIRISAFSRWERKRLFALVETGDIANPLFQSSLLSVDFV